MAVLVKLTIYLLLVAVGAGIGFGTLSLLDGSGPNGLPTVAPPAAAPAAQIPSRDDQAGGTDKTPAVAGQENSIFQTFTTQFAGRFVSANCVKNRRMENGVAFGEDYLIHYVDGTMMRYITGGYHHVSNDTVEFAIDDDNSELYTIDHSTILLSGIKINKVVIQQSATDAATQSSLRMAPCAPWTKGKPDQQVRPTAPYSDIDGLRLAIQAGDADAAIGFLSHGAALPVKDLEALLANSNVPEASKVNIREQNRGNSGAAATDHK